MDERQIDEIVAQVVQTLKGMTAEVRPDVSVPEPPANPPRLVTETIVEEAATSGVQTLHVVQGAIFTPLARDAIRRHSLVVASALPAVSSGTAKTVTGTSSRSTSSRQVAVGIVPTARELEATVNTSLRDARLTPIRVPTPMREAAHLARQVAGAVSGGHASLGIIVDETGLVGPAIANRVPGVIAATCSTVLSARWARERLGANVLCLASETVAPTLVREIISTWIAGNAAVPSDVQTVIDELDRRD
jgi:ribose 5-phosphate isomerase RpiB